MREKVVYFSIVKMLVSFNNRCNPTCSLQDLRSDSIIYYSKCCYSDENIVE